MLGYALLSQQGMFFHPHRRERPRGHSAT